MLKKQELRKFYKAVEVLDEHFDYNEFDTEIVDKVIELGEKNNLQGINDILNKTRCISADELLEELLNLNIEKINEKSKELGFYPIK